MSELSQVRRADSAGGQLLVLDRQNGQPLAGVAAQAFSQRYDQQARQRIASTSAPARTGPAGRVTLAVIDKQGNYNEQIWAVVLLARGRDSLLVNDYYFGGRFEEQDIDEPEVKTFLFTDRAIYRPGQTVYFKGVMVERAGDQTRVLANKEETVALLDVNGQTVQQATFRTNEFGSFHGSFVLPAGLLNGEMRLQAQEDDDNSSVAFAVEDYKRPTFQVTFAPVEGPSALNQSVTTNGTATAYAGQAIDGATVRYRVVRRTVWPLYRPYAGGAARRLSALPQRPRRG